MKRRFLRFSDATLVLALIGCFAIAAPTLAESTKVISVEEHWELRVSQPDNERSAPQTTMLMSPVGNVDGPHFLFTINHSTVPQYAPGGLQVQQWEGGELVQDRAVHDGVALDKSEEVVHWTQRLTLHDGKLTFQVLSGESATWGSFGGDTLTLSRDTTLTALNSYRPAVSLSESQVGYAENRVVSLILTKLVWVTEDGQVHEQSAPIPIDTSLEE
jgi:hypothetical protein